MFVWVGRQLAFIRDNWFRAGCGCVLFIAFGIPLILLLGWGVWTGGKWAWRETLELVGSSSEEIAVDDSDDDGVIDAADSCPTIAGDPAHAGCPKIQNPAGPQPTLPSTTGPDLPTGPTAGVPDCVLGVTDFDDRDVAMVDGIPVQIQLRGTNQCPSPAFYDPTGVATGQNYNVDLPDGWALFIHSVTAEVVIDSGASEQYTSTPAIMVCGEDGMVVETGVYEGAVRVVPQEWAEALFSEVTAIHDAQVFGLASGQPIGHVTPIYLNCGQ